MADHTARVVWRRDGAAFLGQRYGRGHRWSFDGGVDVPASASPHVVPPPYSDRSAVDPEEAFVAALASCHMLWFLSIASGRGFVVESYEDDATGVLADDDSGKLAMVRITLRPRVAFHGTKRPTSSEHDAMHDRAHAECFLARSVRAEVRVQASDVTPEQLAVRPAAEPTMPAPERRPRAVVEVRDVGGGLWIWRVEHPDWEPDQGWDPVVTSTCVESGGEVLVLDPLAPDADAEELWARLGARPPTGVVILKPDHVRDVDLFARRYSARAFGPDRFDRFDIPVTELEPIYPGSRLPGGIIALYDGRGRNETPLWLPEQRALVFADALTAPDGELRVWATPWHQERAVPALRELLRLPFEIVIVSHGEPVHTRAAYEAALEIEPWSG